LSSLCVCPSSLSSGSFLTHFGLIHMHFGPIYPRLFCWQNALSSKGLKCAAQHNSSFDFRRTKSLCLKRRGLSALIGAPRVRLGQPSLLTAGTSVGAAAA